MLGEIVWPGKGCGVMATCRHCGTEFAPGAADEGFCCHGCKYVYELINEQGFAQFYDLKQGLAVTPVRSRPFEEHDFGWLGPAVAAAEAKAVEKDSLADLELSLEGISCVGCVWLIEKLFSRVEGAVRASAHPSAGRLYLEWVPGRCDIESFLREMCSFGYVAAPARGGGGDYERRKLSARMGLCGGFALNAMGFSLPRYLGMPADFEFAGLFQLIAFISATLAMLVGGGYFIGRAWRSLRAGSLHIDLPISLGLISAYAGSIAGWALRIDKLLYFDFVATFVFLMLGGRLLQTMAVERNRKRMVRQQPVPDALDTEGDPVTREDLAPGTRFFLRSGQALPVASTLVQGAADLSLEWIHGEADPVRFDAGARLPAGAILLSREPALLAADETWRDSLLARLTAPVTGERRNPGLDRLLRVYLLVVMAFGVGGLIAWAWAGNPLLGVQVMISVFVVSCPCALGVSIPLADDLAASAAERSGAFVRSGSLWARLLRVRQIIFDKTGTITLERPLLENPEALASLDDRAATALARMTHRSLHPVSRALLETLGNRGQKLLHTHGPGEPREIPGLGMISDDATGRWTLGRANWTGGDMAPPHSENTATELRQDDQLAASFRFHESLRPGAVEAIRHLESRGMRLHILSGDHPDKVAATASLLGFPAASAHGGLTPTEKESMVRQLDRQDTLYLGDGANDSLAFDAAFVTGTPVVDRSLLESKADFYTLGTGLAFLPELLAIARNRSRAVGMAFSFALVYNLTAVALSLSGRMNPLLAAILMPLSSVFSIGIVATALARKLPFRKKYRMQG
jgi:Cu2+-exporting ATPase